MVFFLQMPLAQDPDMGRVASINALISIECLCHDQKKTSQRNHGSRTMLPVYSRLSKKPWTFLRIVLAAGRQKKCVVIDRVPLAGCFPFFGSRSMDAAVQGKKDRDGLDRVLIKVACVSRSKSDADSRLAVGIQVVIVLLQGLKIWTELPLEREPKSIQ
jgi:hypothetical protein